MSEQETIGFLIELLDSKIDPLSTQELFNKTQDTAKKYQGENDYYLFWNKDKPDEIPMLPQS